MNELISLNQLFNKKIFRIPDYQRGYSWSEQQLTDFWDDIISLSEDRSHYTGMISLKKIKKSDINKLENSDEWLINEGYDYCHIIDGQQRLTTFIIFISSLIKYCNKKGINKINNIDLEDIKYKYIFKSQNKNNILKGYLFGYEVDNPSFEFLRDRILEQNPVNLYETFYTYNLEYALIFFDNKFDSNSLDKNQVEVLFNKVCNKLLFNINNIDENFDVYVAFETMNNRGKKLSNLELLKNRLIYLTTLYPNSCLDEHSKEELRKSINESWREIYHNLGRNKKNLLNDDEYLRNHWILFFQYSRKKGDDYASFLLNSHFTSNKVYEHISEKSPGVSPEDIHAYSQSTKSIVSHWYKSFNPEQSDLSIDEIEWINKLNRLGIASFRPLVVASLVINTSAENRIKLLKCIEKFIFVMFRMAKHQSSYYSSNSYSLAKDLLLGNKSIEYVIDSIENEFINERNNAIKEFNLKINSYFEKYNGFYSWYELKYLFFEYEHSLYLQERVVKMNDWSNFTKNEKDKISIEHIYPQTDTKFYWRNKFRDYDKNERKKLSNSLGNLLAISQSINSSLQNDEFEKKKNPINSRTKGYSNGSHSEMEVASFADWTPKEILARGLKLLDYMCSRWDIEICDDIKYNLLGLEFMENERPTSPELIESMETRDLEVQRHLDNASTELVDLYKLLIEKLKSRINDLIECSTTEYIGFKVFETKSLCEVTFRKTQINISSKEPKKETNKIGGKLPECYKWTNNYRTVIKNADDIDDILNVLIDVYEQIVNES